MTPLQLEQLISGYLDDELSVERKLEAEILLQSDSTAKTLYDELLAMRNEIRNTRRQNLPFDFQQRLFERIDRETVFISGKPVEKNTTVDFTQPATRSPVAEPMPEWQRPDPATRGTWLTAGLLAHLRNPRVWAVPTVAVALVVGLTLFAVHFYSGDRQIAQVPPVIPPVIDPVVSPGEQNGTNVPPSPLADGDNIPGSAASQPLEVINGKPVVEVSLTLSQKAQDGHYIPKLLADCGYSYIIRENGNKPVTVYEFEMPVDQLLPLITLMYLSREEIVDYKLPDAILTLLHRPAEPGLLEPATESTVIVRLKALKDK